MLSQIVTVTFLVTVLGRISPTVSQANQSQPLNSTERKSPQQLVNDCGVPRPINIFFPSNRRELAPLRRRRRFVVGGTDVIRSPSLPVGRWPWMVLIGVQRGDAVLWGCGGTLISSSTVLTAAHCVVNRLAGEFRLRLGEYALSTSDDGSHTDALVSRIIRHPGHRRKHNDIALLVLTAPVTFSARIRPACLPPASSDHTGQSATLAGWGNREHDARPADVLQEVTLLVADEEKCESTYRSEGRGFEHHFPGGFQGTKICASSADGEPRDACQGDSGGPLVVRGDDERYQVIGLVSVGVGCGSPELPGIYTKVSKYIPWILENSA